MTFYVKKFQVSAEGKYFSSEVLAFSPTTLAKKMNHRGDASCDIEESAV